MVPLEGQNRYHHGDTDRGVFGVLLPHAMYSVHFWDNARLVHFGRASKSGLYNMLQLELSE